MLKSVTIFMRNGLEIRLAEINDLSEWRAVADNVAAIFDNPQMADDPEFIEYAERKLAQKEVFTAVDESGKCIGFIGFSRNFNRITWFGIHENYRGRGIGSKLLKLALNELDASKEITVDTFRDNHALGKPALDFYLKHGFVLVDNTIYDNLGNERCKLAIQPGLHI